VPIELTDKEVKALSDLTGMSEGEIRDYTKRYPIEPLFIFPCLRCLIAIRPIVKLRACIACVRKRR